MSPRRAGLLLHPTSLPGPGGIGTLGPAAHHFLDQLADAGCTLWQMLPLGPTGYGDSPYQSFSSFAGNPLLIHLDDPTADANPKRVDYEAVIARKRTLLRDRAEQSVPDDDYRRFVRENAHWLGDYAHFMALKELYAGAPWTAWGADAAHHDLDASAAPEPLRQQVHRLQVEQYLFATQFSALRAAAAARGIVLMGDVPIYIAHDSADAWAHRDLLQLNEDGSPRVQAGVPPDYFSPTGQLWGNPLYEWPRHAASGYAWWIARLRHAFTRFDLVRLDHFRGFAAYWEVAGDATTAIDGRWVPGPGKALFDALTAAPGIGPLVAEDLGEITPDVIALRDACALPGMAVLQFGFGSDATSVHLPHNWTRHTVAYTGTHDNDTAAGWWDSLRTSATASPPVDTAADGALPTSDQDDHTRHTLEYLNTSETEVPDAMIRAVLASVADTAIIPVQDLLGLGSEARLNHPGQSGPNWQWRLAPGQLKPEVLARFRELALLYGRFTPPAAPARTDPPATDSAG